MDTLANHNDQSTYNFPPGGINDGPQHSYTPNQNERGPVPGHLNDARQYVEAAYGQVETREKHRPQVAQLLAEITAGVMEERSAFLARQILGEQQGSQSRSYLEDL